MCAASGDAGWFSTQHKSQGQHLYVQAWHQCTEGFFVIFGKQIYTMHSAVCIHAHIHISNQQVANDKFEDEDEQQCRRMLIQDVCCCLGALTYSAVF